MDAVFVNVKVWPGCYKAIDENQSKNISAWWTIDISL